MADDQGDPGRPNRPWHGSPFPREFDPPCHTPAAEFAARAVQGGDSVIATARKKSGEHPGHKGLRRLQRACLGYTVPCLLAAGMLAGCETLYNAGVPGMARFVDFEAKRAEEEDYRTRYQETGDPAAMSWLLTHRIKSGMSLEAVESVFGEAGARESNSRWLTTKGGHYRAGDIAYRWGPDAEGHSVYLIFREGMLVNFNPHEFEDGMETAWDKD